MALIKKQNQNGVLLLLENKFPNVPRYDNDGGFTVYFCLNQYVRIEFVGKGFDGGDITREKAMHESYNIPWQEVLFIKDRQDMIKNCIIDKYVVDEEEYTRTRETRKDYLIGENKDDESIVNQNLPIEYKKIDESMVEKVIKDIVHPLYSKTGDLYYDNLKIFKVQGNMHSGNLIPFEIFRPERLIEKKEIEENREEK